MRGGCAKADLQIVSETSLARKNAHWPAEFSFVLLSLREPAISRERINGSNLGSSPKTCTNGFWGLGHVLLSLNFSFLTYDVRVLPSPCRNALWSRWESRSGKSFGSCSVGYVCGWAVHSSLRLEFLKASDEAIDEKVLWGPKGFLHRRGSGTIAQPWAMCVPRQEAGRAGQWGVPLRRETV